MRENSPALVVTEFLKVSEVGLTIAARLVSSNTIEAVDTHPNRGSQR